MLKKKGAIRSSYGESRNTASKGGGFKLESAEQEKCIQPAGSNFE